MITAQGESIEFALYKRKENSPYEWEDSPALTFLGRLANDIERKQYRIQQGVNGSSESVYILCSNLPLELRVGDQIEYLGKKSTIQNTGYYLNQSRIVNFKIMNHDYIVSRSPKGIVIG